MKTCELSHLSDPVLLRDLATLIARDRTTPAELLAPHLTEATAAGLLGSAMNKIRPEIEQMLAERFPRPDVLGWVAEMTGSRGPRSPANMRRRMCVTRQGWSGGRDAMR